MTPQDPLALVRSRDSFTLDEAARIVCDVPPLRVYSHRRVDWTQELRDEYEMVAEALRMLKADAESLGVTVKIIPATATRKQSFVTGEMHAEVTPERHEYGSVSREALRAWCDRKQICPAFFHDGASDAPAKKGAAAVAEMNANRALAVMAWLIAKQGGKYMHGEKPNVSQISNAVTETAEEFFGEDVKGFKQFRRRLTVALKELPDA